MMPSNLVLLVPVYNDWVSVARLIAEIDGLLDLPHLETRVLLVNDGSSVSPDDEMDALRPEHIRQIDILKLRRNVGHQRAIAIGLAYVDAKVSCDTIVVMDGDGEDRPADVPRLVAEAERANGRAIVFAERTRRSEGAVFLIMYGLYRLTHRVLTGERVRVGNFSAIPRDLLSSLVSSSDLWNHYAAAVFKSRIPYRTLPTTRARRYAGVSQMNYVALVTHGLTAMSVFGDRIGVRLLTASGVSSMMLVAALAAVVAAVATGVTIPRWALFGFALLVLALIQSLALVLTFVFIILAGRDSATFLPLRDYQYFVDSIHTLMPRPHAAVSVPG